MRTFESIIVVGSSGAGKSSLVDGLRGKGFEDKVAIPNRYTTRPQRENDNMTENTHISPERFHDGVQRRVIEPYWTRPMEGDRRERYGFQALSTDDDRLRVYSANNAFLRNPNTSIRRVLERGLVVVVAASLKERDTRLAERSADMNKQERIVRLRDDGTDMLTIHPDTEVIHTTGVPVPRGQQMLQDLVHRILVP